jgi:tetratricopeptide (TPR) repeat protein
MKAEQRKEIETNSLVLAVQRFRKHASGRTAYYAIGTVALIVAAVLIYRYFAGETKKARDAVLLQLASADTPEKLKQGMEDHRGSVYGSLFKLNLARHMLLNEGLPRLGTDRTESLKQAAASVEQGRTYYLELTSELKEKDEPALVQEAWGNAAQAEEALVGLPATEGGTDYRGNPDKAIEYYEKAASIFPDTDFSKKYKARADYLRANKDQFLAEQKAIYKPADPLPPFKFPPAPGKTDSLGPLGPILPPLPSTPKGDVPPSPPAPVIPPPPTPESKVPADPMKSPDLKPPDPPKSADPKSK